MMKSFVQSWKFQRIPLSGCSFVFSFFILLFCNTKHFDGEDAVHRNGDLSVFLLLTSTYWLHRFPKKFLLFCYLWWNKPSYQLEMFISIAIRLFQTFSCQVRPASNAPFHYPSKLKFSNLHYLPDGWTRYLIIFPLQVYSMSFCTFQLWE